MTAIMSNNPSDTAFDGQKAGTSERNRLINVNRYSHQSRPPRDSREKKTDQTYELPLVIQVLPTRHPEAPFFYHGRKVTVDIGDITSSGAR